MNTPTWQQRPIQDFLPHHPPMLLLDRIVMLGEHHLETEVSIENGSPFERDGAVGAWVGVEYMAQTIAAFAGIEAQQRGEAPRIGFLLGTREYKTAVSAFPVGSKLRVLVEQVHREVGGLSVVECQIRKPGESEPLVQATLTVYEVTDIQGYLAEHAGASS